MKQQSCISTPEFEQAVKRVHKRPYSEIKANIEADVIAAVRAYVAKNGIAIHCTDGQSDVRE